MARSASSIAGGGRQTAGMHRATLRRERMRWDAVRPRCAIRIVVRSATFMANGRREPAGGCGGASAVRRRHARARHAPRKRLAGRYAPRSLTRIVLDGWRGGEWGALGRGGRMPLRDWTTQEWYQDLVRLSIHYFEHYHQPTSRRDGKPGRLGNRSGLAGEQRPDVAAHQCNSWISRSGERLSHARIIPLRRWESLWGFPSRGCRPGPSRDS
jgi:hypothetical protein